MTALTTWLPDEPAPTARPAACRRRRQPRLVAECRLCGYVRTLAPGRPTPAATTGVSPVTNDPARRHGRSGWPCRWPATSSATWPSSTAAASGPVQLRRTDLATGQTEHVLVPCGHTLASVCPSCAERAKTLRAAQCREGWHLDHEPDHRARRPAPTTRQWLDRDTAPTPRPSATRPKHAARTPTELGRADSPTWTRRSPAPGCAATCCPTRPERRHRSTRRRQDAPPLPRRDGRPRARSARPTPRRTARRSGRRCSSP